MTLVEVSFLVPPGLCSCGCGQPTLVAGRTRQERGWVRGQPQPCLRGHRPRTVRFAIAPGPLGSPCWEWGDTLNPGGYATMSVDGLPARGHRWLYEQFVGPIPEGLHIDHLCRVRSCVNPAHLEPVTPLENARRGAKTKLDDKAVRDICTSGESTKELAVRYSISRTYVQQLRRGCGRGLEMSA